MRYIFVLALVLVACSNPNGIGNQTIPDGEWWGYDRIYQPVSCYVGTGHVSELTWTAFYDSLNHETITAPPLPLRPHISFDTTSAFGNSVHIEADWLDGTWDGWHQVDDQPVVSFVLTLQ